VQSRPRSPEAVFFCPVSTSRTHIGPHFYSQLGMIKFMRRHSLKISDEAKIGCLQGFLLRQLMEINSCPDSEFESRFSRFIIDFEEFFRSKKSKNENNGFDEGNADTVMYLKLTEIFHHAAKRISSNDIRFARKIIFLLSYRLSKSKMHK
jgi:hypothetical protein